MPQKTNTSNKRTKIYSLMRGIAMKKKLTTQIRLVSTYKCYAQLSTPCLLTNPTVNNTPPPKKTHTYFMLIKQIHSKPKSN